MKNKGQLWPVGICYYNSVNKISFNDNYFF